MSAYSLDTTAARQADVSGRIDESGKYIGQFTKAKKVSSNKGTEGIEFSFESNNGQSADYLTLWTVNKEGKQIYGFKQLMALMTCLKARNIESKDGEVEEYDSVAKQVVRRKVEIYPGLMDKEIGILIQMEEYEKKDGSIGTKASFAGFFDSKTEQTAAEILDKQNANALEKMIGNLIPVKKLKSSRPSFDSMPNYSTPDRFIDDDIPFLS